MIQVRETQPEFIMKTCIKRLFLLPTLITCLGLIPAGRVTAQSSCTLPPSGLVSWFPMENSVTDMVGGVLPLATNALSFVPGEVGQGVSLGTGGYIDLANFDALENQQFTWEAWVRWDGPGPTEDASGSIILENTLSGSFGYALSARASDNRFVFTCGTIISSAIVSSNTFTQGLFYHVAGTYDGATFKLYVNGSLEAQINDAGTLSWGNFWSIGANPAFARNEGFPRTWNGVIDEVSIYNRALSASEIQAIYNAGSAGKCMPLQLTIFPSGTNVILTWPTNFTGFTLQSTPNLFHWQSGRPFLRHRSSSTRIM
jgi:hypothetical protein